jgi:hypothetical protein
MKVGEVYMLDLESIKIQTENVVIDSPNSPPKKERPNKPNRTTNKSSVVVNSIMYKGFPVVYVSVDFARSIRKRLKTISSNRDKYLERGVNEDEIGAYSYRHVVHIRVSIIRIETDINGKLHYLCDLTEINDTKDISSVIIVFRREHKDPTEYRMKANHFIRIFSLSS